MSTRNNKGDYKPKAKPVEEISAETYIPQELKEKYNTPEAKKEAIEKLAEEEAKIFDAQEELFLESNVAEIEVQPVNEAEEPCTCDETCVCTDETCTDPECTCEKDEVDAAVEEFKKLPDVQPENIEETLEEFHNVDAKAEIAELVQKAVAPEPVKALRPKTLIEMTATEINIYYKTGILPLI
jgi:hypothetical protein